MIDGHVKVMHSSWISWLAMLLLDQWPFVNIWFRFFDNHRIIFSFSLLPFDWECMKHFIGVFDLFWICTRPLYFGLLIPVTLRSGCGSPFSSLITLWWSDSCICLYCPWAAFIKFHVDRIILLDYLLFLIGNLQIRRSFLSCRWI